MCLLLSLTEGLPKMVLSNLHDNNHAYMRSNSLKNNSYELSFIKGICM